MKVHVDAAAPFLDCVTEVSNFYFSKTVKLIFLIISKILVY